MLKYYYEIDINGETINGYVDVPKGSTDEDITQEIKNKNGLSISYAIVKVGVE